jgi:hypothetical protein
MGMKRQSVSIYVVRGFPLMIAVLVFLCSVPEIVRADYSISGRVTVYAEGTDSSQRYQRNVAATALFDNMVSNGPAGNKAGADYYANLATGQLGASAYARDGFVPVYDQWGQFVGYDNLCARGDSYVAMQDVLHFNFPKGTYDSDVYFTLHGQATGTMTTVYQANAYGGFLAEILSANTDRYFWKAVMLQMVPRLLWMSPSVFLCLFYLRANTTTL